ncbi:MAG: DUF2142 domain-containing protein [Chloroflexia bacterium]|nr:DUF2142 domain-containing protein [Chloroflexia bacterium]
MTEIAEPFHGMAVPATRSGERPGRAGVRSRLAGLTSVQRFMLVLTALYLVKQILLVVIHPPFSGHDEVAHFAYLRTVVDEQRLPVLLEDRLPADLYPYCRYVLQWWCEPWNPRWVSSPPVRLTNGQLEGMQYAANHPPLYYVLMAPLATISAGWGIEAQQTLLRFAAIPFGLLLVLLAYRTVTALFPGDRFLAITVPTFVAFQPQVSYEAAMVNNDAMAIALAGAILYVLVRVFRDRYPRGACLLLGFLFGLALLTKGTSVTIAPSIGAAVVAAVGWRDIRGIAWRGATIGGMTVLLAFPWYLFLWRTYGNFSALPQVSELQQWNRPLGGFVELLTDRSFFAMRFHESWGYFGWRMIPLPEWLLWTIGVPLLVAAGGFVQYTVLTARTRPADDLTTHADPVMRPEAWQRWLLGVMVLTCLVGYLAVVQFGTQFELTQARYFFPAINAIAIVLMLGLRTLIPVRWHTPGQAGVVLAMVGFNVLIYTQFVIPFWHL